MEEEQEGDGDSNFFNTQLSPVPCQQKVRTMMITMTMT